VKHGARWAALAVGLVVVVLGIVLALNVGTDPQADTQRSELVGKPAPAFELRTLDDQPLALADVAGKSVLVNFWNTWCIPCQEELPALKSFYEKHAHDADFVMVGVVRRDDTGTVRKFVRGEGLSWTIALDPDKQAALDFGTRGQPETYAISPSGQIVAAKYGPMAESELETFLSVARASG
jgi:cytochrome c biogenesis protein CcmG/thiol:disulfide interchange protein DsbE